MIAAMRYHDISCGHRVVGHEGKCRHLHGHNYRVHFSCVAADGLDAVGRVIDFSVIKEKLCMWLEENWDHKFLMWEDDPLTANFHSVAKNFTSSPFAKESHITHLNESFVYVPFNPTAENLAKYLVDVIGPRQLLGTGVILIAVKIEETAKCSALYTRGSIG